jgi:predicted aminopeptidase
MSICIKFRHALVLSLALLATGCADTSYLLQSARGHFDIMRAARPVDQWLAGDTVEANLQQRLRLAQQLRRYAIDTLKLPDNASYTRYAELPRRAVVWNVVATPAYSLTPKEWCFPVAGCVSYRGYFDELDARSLADSLRHQGWEATVYGVPAYSTLGWTNWLGGDPLLSTFIHYPQGELARMIFHELAHQVLYLKNDTAFNESFATAVERLGSDAWLRSQASPAVQQETIRFDTRRVAFRALTSETRKQLNAIYTIHNGATAPTAQLEALKSAAYTRFRTAYGQLKSDWGGYDRYDAWVAGANNASFAALAAYDDWVDAFEALFLRGNGDWEIFYAEVKALADKPRDERMRTLQQLQRARR